MVAVVGTMMEPFETSARQLRGERSSLPERDFQVAIFHRRSLPLRRN